MIINRLNIVLLNNWAWLPTSEQHAELVNGTDALSKKYEPHLGAERLKVIRLSTSSMMDTFAPKESDKGFSGADCGTYVIGHTEGTAASSIGGLDPAKLAALLTQLNVVPVRKLCLLACGAANKSAVAFPGGNPTYLRELCAELKDPTMAVAGWVHFVTVTDEGHKGIKVPWNVKGPVVRARDHKDERAKYKEAVRFDAKDGVKKLDRWSDKDRLSWAVVNGKQTVLWDRWWDQ